MLPPQTVRKVLEILSSDFQPTANHIYLRRIHSDPFSSNLKTILKSVTKSIVFTVHLSYGPLIYLLLRKPLGDHTVRPWQRETHRTRLPKRPKVVMGTCLIAILYLQSEVFLHFCVAFIEFAQELMHCPYRNFISLYLNASNLFIHENNLIVTLS